MFQTDYEQERERRGGERGHLAAREAATEQIPDAIDREIAALMRVQERTEQKRTELERLKALVEHFDATQARERYGDRVANALERAMLRSSFSTLDALDRELSRSIDDEEWLMHVAIKLLLEDH